MKVTLKYFSHLPRTSAPVSPSRDSLSPASNRTEHSVKSTRPCAGGLRNSALLGSCTSSNRHGKATFGLGVTKKSSLSINKAYPLDAPATHLLNTSSTRHMSTVGNQESVPALLTADSWLFSFTARELRNNTASIPLTVIESMLLKTLTLSSERICSKQELIFGIDKDPDTYSGLEMCLSRLQNKFKAAFGERLFRSVRNRGYCLVQEVHNTR